MPPEIEQQLLQGIARLEVHMETMALNQMSLADKVSKHVDLCNKRNTDLEVKVATLDERMDGVGSSVKLQWIVYGAISAIFGTALGILFERMFSNMGAVGAAIVGFFRGVAR